MRFHQPESVDEAVAILSKDENARCLAGGATLVAMMNAQLVEPSQLVSLRHVAELAEITMIEDGAVRIGGMVLHQTIATTDLFNGGQAVVADAARQIGHPAIRNMGTLGGAISHADPAADYPAALVAADAVVEIAGPGGRRELGAEAFFVDYLETALEAGELVVAVRLPKAAAGAAGAYEKLTRIEGDFATASVAAVLSMNAGTCTDVRLAVGACAAVPVRIEAAEDALKGTGLDDSAINRAADLLTAQCDPISDFRGSAEYRLSMIPVLLGRVLGRARRRLES